MYRRKLSITFLLGGKYEFIEHIILEWYLVYRPILSLRGYHRGALLAHRKEGGLSGRMVVRSARAAHQCHLSLGVLDYPMAKCTVRLVTGCVARG